MGASSWTYFAPYNAKPSVSLRKLRQQVFASGQYRPPATAQERIAQARQLPSAADTHRQTAEKLRQMPGAADSPDIQRMIALSEQMAKQAAAAEPEYRRFLDALATGTADGLPAAERRHFELFQNLSATSPTLRRQFGGPNGTPGSIEELLERAGENGTHSILDITRVARRAAHATAFPLRPDLLVANFGTLEPTRVQAEAAEMSFVEELNWQAVYFAVYQGGQPVAWAFVGSSGD